MNRITEKTLIPISLVITILGGIIWLTILAENTKANTQSLTNLETEHRALAKDLVETQKKMIESLTRIETKLNIKTRNNAGL